MIEALTPPQAQSVTAPKPDLRNFIQTQIVERRDEVPAEILLDKLIVEIMEFLSRSTVNPIVEREKAAKLNRKPKTEFLEELDYD